jgi:hypothetical protein
MNADGISYRCDGSRLIITNGEERVVQFPCEIWETLRFGDVIVVLNWLEQSRSQRR